MAIIAYRCAAKVEGVFYAPGQHINVINADEHIRNGATLIAADTAEAEGGKPVVAKSAPKRKTSKKS